MNPVLSILTPAIPERLEKLIELRRLIETQQASLPAGSIEWLVWCDTRGARTVGEKRDDLVRMARGQFVAFVDDDDAISGDYCQRLLESIAAAPEADVVTFCQHVTWNGHQGTVRFGLGNENDAWRPSRETLRAPWHVCAFRASLAKGHHFPASNYGEDWAWARHVGADCKAAAHIPAILHFYRHDQAHTAAPPPLHP